MKGDLKLRFTQANQQSLSTTSPKQLQKVLYQEISKQHFLACHNSSHSTTFSFLKLNNNELKIWQNLLK